MLGGTEESIKTNAQILFGVSVVSLLATGCNPSGPLTARELTSLTNSVAKIASEPISRIYNNDGHWTQVMVCTGSVTNGHDFVFDRTRFGFHRSQSATK